MCAGKPLDLGTGCRTLKQAIVSGLLLGCTPNVFLDESKDCPCGKRIPSPALGRFASESWFRHEPSIQTCAESVDVDETAGWPGIANLVPAVWAVPEGFTDQLAVAGFLTD